MNERFADFLDPRISPRTVDNHLIRSRILEALRRELPNLGARILDLGAGDQPYRSLVEGTAGVAQYVAVDLPGSSYSAPDVAWDGTTLPLPDSSFDGVLATELFEHVPDPQKVMAEALRVLRPGGTLFFTVPFLWPLHCAPHDEYRYTPWSLTRHLESAGFAGVGIRALGGWDASLAQMIGLWARRRPMGRLARALATRLAVPAVALLERSDRPAELGEGSLFPGLCGTARRPD